MAASRSACSRRLFCLASGLHINPVSSPQCLFLHLLVCLDARRYCSESYTAHRNLASSRQCPFLNLWVCLDARRYCSKSDTTQSSKHWYNWQQSRLALVGVCPTQRCRQSVSQQSSMFTRLVYIYLHQTTGNTRGSNACAYAQQPLAEMHVAVPLIKHLSCQ